MAGKIFNILVHFLTRLNIRDTQCGFKAYQGEAARRIFARQLLDGFSFDVEILYLGYKTGLKILEVPVRWNHSPDTKVRMVRHSVSMFIDLRRIRWNYFLRRYHPEPQVRQSPRLQTTDIDAILEKGAIQQVDSMQNPI